MRGTWLLTGSEEAAVCLKGPAAPLGPPCAAGQVPAGQLPSFHVLTHRASDCFLVSLHVLALRGYTDSSVPVGRALACHWPQALTLHHFLSWHYLSLAYMSFHPSQVSAGQPGGQLRCGGQQAFLCPLTPCRHQLGAQLVHVLFATCFLG